MGIENQDQRLKRGKFRLPEKRPSINTACATPESECWLHTPCAAETLSRSTQCAEQLPAKKSNLGVIQKGLKQRR